MRLLLLEDDAMLGSNLKKGLEYNEYSVEWFQTGQEALEAAELGHFDLAIFDINLPDISGIEVLKKVRKTPALKALPILLLTVNDVIERKVAGLDAGADDYMIKPFDLKELLARLRALIRRKDGQTDNILRSRDLELNTTNHSVTVLKTGKTYMPSGKEFKTLILLMQRPGNVISKDRIEEDLYGWDGDVESNTVEVIIYNLRKKLGKETILTLRGVGYMVSP